MGRKKSWQDKFDGAKAPHVSVLEEPFAGVPAGGRLFIADPALLDDWISLIPPGRTETIAAFRQAMATRHAADATCPASTGIFLRIVAERACEQLASGREPAQVTPFWRMIEPGSALAVKLSCGADFIATQREIEARGQASNRATGAQSGSMAARNAAKSASTSDKNASAASTAISALRSLKRS